MCKSTPFLMHIHTQLTVASSSAYKSPALMALRSPPGLPRDLHCRDPRVDHDHQQVDEEPAKRSVALPRMLCDAG